MQTRLRNWFRLLAAFIIFGVALALIMDKIVMPVYVRHGKEIVMMDVRKKHTAEAINLLKMGGFGVQVVDTVEGGNLPKGVVVDQQPPPGNMVKKGHVVNLIITGGEHFFQMPNLVGRVLKSATIIIENQKLVLDTVEYLYSSDKPEGVVCEQSLLPGSMVGSNTPVRLVVSRGKPSHQLEVPMLTGLNLEEAKASIRKAGFKIGLIRYVPTPDLTPYTVIDQTPKAGHHYDNPVNIDLQVTNEP
ncbi:MAG: PASTA domain-containing protein [Candidatus Neomarinimicrobiota bacterium]